jgi:hypothetical protein
MQGVQVWLHAFLTSALDGGEWSASHPGLFTPRERATGTHCIGGWVGPRTGLGTVVKRKIPLCRDSNPRYEVWWPISRDDFIVSVPVYLQGSPSKYSPWEAKHINLLVYLRSTPEWICVNFHTTKERLTSNVIFFNVLSLSLKYWRYRVANLCQLFWSLHVLNVSSYHC